MSQPPYFSQSGQLDWVALSRTPISYSVEVVNRLAQADVELVTIKAATAICSSFLFPPEGQNQLTRSLTKLSSCFSYGRAIWFGFGLKHVVRSLADTEEGATCVAILAALAIPYSSYTAGCVLRDLCLLYEAPSQLRPSIAQWTNMVEVCSGSLGRSNFDHHYQAFTELIVSNNQGRKPAATSKDIANALEALADLSREAIVCVVFVGQLDCAWLAAVAHSLFLLCIEIRDGSGNCLYRSSTKPPSTPAQAIFIGDHMFEQFQSSSYAGLLIQRKVFVRPNGTCLLQHDWEGRVNQISCWESVMIDAFPGYWDHPGIKILFGKLLELIALHSKEHFSAMTESATKKKISWLYWHDYGYIYHPRRTGDELLEFALQVSPPGFFADGSLRIENCTTSLPSIPDQVEEILDQISRRCRCISCRDRKTVLPYGLICYRMLAIALVRVVVLLSPITINPDITPVPDALRELYHYGMSFPQFGDPKTFPKLAILLHLFTGRMPSVTGRIPSPQILEDDCSAASHHGVCVYYSLLKDINLSPTDAIAVEVIRGSIGFKDKIYELIQDSKVSLSASEINPRIMSHAQLAQHSEKIPNMEVELLVEERNRDFQRDSDVRSLSVRYRCKDLTDVYDIGGVSHIQRTIIKNLKINKYLFEDTAYHSMLEFSNDVFPLQLTNAESTRMESWSSLNSRFRWCWCVITWTSTVRSMHHETDDVLYPFLYVDLSTSTDAPLLFLVSMLGILDRFALVRMRDCIKSATMVAFKLWSLATQDPVGEVRGEVRWVTKPDHRIKFRYRLQEQDLSSERHPQLDQMTTNQVVADQHVINRSDLQDYWATLADEDDF